MLLIKALYIISYAIPVTFTLEYIITNVSTLDAMTLYLGRHLLCSKLNK